MARDRKGTVELQIADALIKSGCTNLNQQAKALGVRRSTAWTIVKGKHKLGRLNTRTTERILANPDTPPAVRDVVRQYLNQKV
jgi:predicted transcriptional regulator